MHFSCNSSEVYRKVQIGLLKIVLAILTGEVVPRIVTGEVVPRIVYWLCMGLTVNIFLNI